MCAHRREWYLIVIVPSEKKLKSFYSIRLQFPLILCYYYLKKIQIINCLLHPITDTSHWSYILDLWHCILQNLEQTWDTVERINGCFTCAGLSLIRFLPSNPQYENLTQENKSWGRQNVIDGTMLWQAWFIFSIQTLNFLPTDIFPKSQSEKGVSIKDQQ